MHTLTLQEIKERVAPLGLIAGPSRFQDGQPGAYMCRAGESFGRGFYLALADEELVDALAGLVAAGEHLARFSSAWDGAIAGARARAKLARCEHEGCPARFRRQGPQRHCPEHRAQHKAPQARALRGEVQCEHEGCPTRFKRQGPQRYCPEHRAQHRPVAVSPSYVPRPARICALERCGKEYQRQGATRFCCDDHRDEDALVQSRRAAFLAQLE